LLRTHTNVTSQVAASSSPFVVDVSAHPDVAELYLAADALVSDYSSAVFDFAVTRKPIVLFAPDLDRYRDDVRGLYFDYEKWAPGPVTRTSAELAEALAAVAALPDRDQRDVPRYADFLARFCPHEDGRAGERVVERIRSVLGRG
jgi:CDP-glycerol glycerophosphotransferase